MTLHTRHPLDERASGAILLEFALGLTLLTVGLLAFMQSFFTNYRAINVVNEMDELHFAFENAAETLASTPLSDVYANFDGTSIALPNLKDPAGGPAQLQVTCFVDENAIPPEFGPIADIDGNVSQLNADASAVYQVLPVRLRTTYASSDGPQTRDFYVLLGAD